MTLAVLKVISGYLRIAAIVLQFAFCISFIFVVGSWSNTATHGVLYYFVAMSAFACLFSIVFLLYLILRKQDDNRLLVSIMNFVDGTFAGIAGATGVVFAIYAGYWRDSIGLWNFNPIAFGFCSAFAFLAAIVYGVDAYFWMREN